MNELEMAETSRGPTSKNPREVTKVGNSCCGEREDGALKNNRAVWKVRHSWIQGKNKAGESPCVDTSYVEHSNDK